MGSKTSWSRLETSIMQHVQGNLAVYTVGSGNVFQAVLTLGATYVYYFKLETRQHMKQ